MNSLDKCMAVVIGHFLSDYPSDKSYDEILDLIREEDPDVTIWEPFENYHPDDVIEYMENLKLTLMQEFCLEGEGVQNAA